MAPDTAPDPRQDRIPDSAAQHFHGDETFDRLAGKIDAMVNTCGRCKQLEAALAEAIEEVEGWGTYASGYFQEKWDLRGTVDRLRRVLNGE